MAGRRRRRSARAGCVGPCSWTRDLFGRRSTIRSIFGNLLNNDYNSSNVNLRILWQSKQILYMGKVSRRIDKVKLSFSDSCTISCGFLKLDLHVFLNWCFKMAPYYVCYEYIENWIPTVVCTYG